MRYFLLSVESRGNDIDEEALEYLSKRIGQDFCCNVFIPIDYRPPKSYILGFSNLCMFYPLVTSSFGEGSIIESAESFMRYYDGVSGRAVGLSYDTSSSVDCGAIKKAGFSPVSLRPFSVCGDIPLGSPISSGSLGERLPNGAEIVFMLADFFPTSDCLGTWAGSIADSVEENDAFITVDEYVEALEV